MTYARRMWPAFETYHAHIYFVPEAAEAYRLVGLKGGWMGSRRWPGGRCSPLCGRCPGPTSRISCCGTPAHCCGSTGATATWHRSPPPASTAARPMRTERLLELLTPMARAINAAGGVPVPNPVGVPAA